MENFSIQELGLPDDIWQPFAHLRPAVHYRAGQLIYLQDTHAEGFFYLKEGQVKTFISSEEGGEKLLTVYRAGNLFGEASFFDGLPRVSSAMAVSACEVVCIDRAAAAAALSDDPALALALLKYLARTVRMLSTHVDSMAFRPAEQRVIRHLLSLPRDAAGKVRCTQEEIAAAVGASRVTVSRIISRLARQGLLHTGYGTLIILEPERLARTLCPLE